MSKIVIGIDQSYTRTGITILKDKQIIEMLSIGFKDCETNTDKRNLIDNILSELILEFEDEGSITVITERIRLTSQGFLSEAYIKATGALIATIIDVCRPLGIPVYSVDTRSWKSQIIGNSKPLKNPYGINPEKYRTIVYLRDKGLLKHIVEPYEGNGKKGIIGINMDVVERGKKVRKKVPCKINDDLADSYCIAMYGFLPESKQKLKEETF